MPRIPIPYAVWAGSQLFPLRVGKKVLESGAIARTGARQMSSLLVKTAIRGKVLESGAIARTGARQMSSLLVKTAIRGYQVYKVV